MDFNELLTAEKEYLIELRREFHKNPEKSWHEYQTSRRIKEELDKIGVKYQSFAGTGVVAVIEGAEEGKTVALRADMDALELDEETELSFKSENEGLMHACGHDGHTAMLLTAARALVKVKDKLSGKIKLIFQPAEEMVAGAKEMVKEGALEDVEAVLGIHLWSGLKTGIINVEAGPRMASGDYVMIDFIGAGGHGSLPQQTVDPIAAASAFVMESQAVMSRESSPLDPVVFTIGKIDSGSRFNIIPSQAALEGTLRCFSEESRTAASEAIKRFAKKTASAYRAEAEVEIKEGTPPTVNDPQIVEYAQRAARQIVGDENLVSMQKTTGSEDMAYYLREVPGCMAFVGAGFEDQSKNFPHHHPEFNLNEESLLIGASLYFNFALNFLNND
ncbi:M20 family metallopeptidase [Halanaerobium hydrogeniformans]|uniref:Amidohydrolase n=1 Tax=Halanaerobium hydrogeniformans TaxID=656519 RepID=E4RPB1_HALHG|nr:M20 family metallopeptidase [Halanaerobium hydrogeniformans]ADQ13796.1 amidohydrolase [Halanaerobium hydrogeniformans]